MNIDTTELGALADMLGAQKLAAMQEKLDAAEKEKEYWKSRCERAEQLHTASAMENRFLKNYIMLSAEKIMEFVRTLKSIDHWALLRTFVQWSVPKELEAVERERIEEVMPLPLGVDEAPTTYNTFESGSACQVFNNKAEITTDKKE